MGIFAKENPPIWRKFFSLSEWVLEVGKINIFARGIS